MKLGKRTAKCKADHESDRETETQVLPSSTLTEDGLDASDKEKRQIDRIWRLRSKHELRLTLGI